ncbi:hypothetical protein CONPUDRAFT_167254 [Coniophora puteana RWD-64-598 SS2]|uniref:NAD(P)-binding protein n=1 Tax=Coniophora puteana (strain RWD-64-598) TaxID=741705 RepID=A0A5M3MGW5_CONPW|nr:uncharacterized protein CONPUDRAFT_167254 [Coniophora puteana RWD-64-598 SS2]EIW78190.1 hypothetical protein CONPUDRAFT_167254 [Coniophora puteana RWD-64-598 SS2]
MTSTVWFITGASSDIGRPITEHYPQPLSSQHYASPPRSPTSPPFIDQAPACRRGGRGQLIVSTALTAAKDAFSRINVVFNNAGYGTMAEFEGTPEEDARKMVDVNTDVCERPAREPPVLPCDESILCRWNGSADQCKR